MVGQPKRDNGMRLKHLQKLEVCTDHGCWICVCAARRLMLWIQAVSHFRGLPFVWWLKRDALSLPDKNGLRVLIFISYFRNYNG